MFNEIVSEWIKNVSQRVDSFFQSLIQMLHKALKTKDNVSPRCNKARHIGFVYKQHYVEHQNSASERIWFCLINKEIFATTYIESFARQQPNDVTHQKYKHGYKETS